MKLKVIDFVYEPPALQIVPETEYEARLLSRYWKSAKLGVGVDGENQPLSFDGHSYSIKFSEIGQNGGAPV